MNALTIADALAVRYGPAVTSPPAGYPAMRVSTARLPNKIPTSPWVLVMLPDGEVVLAPGYVNYGLNYRVVFHYGKASGDTARDMTAMLAWLGVLLTATYGDMDLGVAGTKKAYPTGFRLTVENYAGDEWYGWDITVRVDFGETQVLTP